MRRRCGLVAAAVACALSLAPAACHWRRDVPLPHPLVLVGVDGLEWRIVLAMEKAGRLPELSALMHEGSFAKLKTLAPALSPPIWTSMATGVLPPRHGILGFARPDVQGPGGEPVLFTNRERRVKALWNMTADAGLRSCVVGYWMTFPVEEFDGVMVAQTATPPGQNPERARKGSLRPSQTGQVWPQDLEQRVFDVAASSRELVYAREKEIFGDRTGWPASMKNLASHSRWSLAADSAYQRIALDLVAGSGKCDVVLVYLGIADVLGHRFWRWTSPGDFSSPPSASEVAMFGDVLPRAYAEVDAFVGEMRRAAGPGATVVVASDHGMGAFRPKTAVDLSKEGPGLARTGGHSAAREAFFAAAGPGIAHAADAATSAMPANIAAVPEAGSIVDLAPTLLALLGLPRGSDMDGHPMTTVLDPAFLAAHPLREVPTVTPEGWAASRRLADVTDEAGSSRRLEQLRGLGYLE